MHGGNANRRARLLAVSVAACLLGGGLALMGGPSAAGNTRDAGYPTFVVNDTGDYSQVSGAFGQCRSTHVVESGNTCTLRAAVQAVDQIGGGTITVPAGTYRFTADRKSPFTAQDNIYCSNAPGSVRDAAYDLEICSKVTATINGAGAGTTILDANEHDRGFTIHRQAELMLTGFTIKDGEPDPTRTVRDISYGTGQTVRDIGYGGGIFSSGFLNLDGDTLIHNDAYYGAGGALAFAREGNDAGSGAVDITDSTLEDNSAHLGGGAIDGTSVTGGHIDSNTISNNVAPTGGGLILGGSLGVRTPASYTLDHDEIDNNAGSQGSGGLLLGYHASLSSNGSSFIGDLSGGAGGAITAGSLESDLTLINATISDNSAVRGAGIFFVARTPATLTNDTIAFNTANTGDGGGIGNPTFLAIDSGHSGVGNTIVAENSGGDCSGSIPAASDAGHNLDSDGSCLGYSGHPSSDQVAFDPMLSGPADNGGPVLTDALQSGSPARDAGSNSLCPATDARGVVRPQGPACDLGAYEAVPAALGLTNTAPSAVTTGQAFGDTITATDKGPGTSTNTIITDQLPANATLFGASPSQGSCSASGSPEKVTCNLGTVAAGAGATVVIGLNYSKPGTATDLAAVCNQEGGCATASAKTVVTQAQSTGQPPVAVTGIAKNVTGHTATLVGSLITFGQKTSYFFQYGFGTTYGFVTAIAQSSTSGAFTATVTNLQPGRLYHFRFVAVNGNGVAYGGDHVFRATGLLGRLLLGSHVLTIVKGRVTVPLICQSDYACDGKFSIDHKARIAGTRAEVHVVCTRARFAIYAIRPRSTKNVNVPLLKSCLATIGRRHRLKARFTSGPRTGQRSLVGFVTLVSK